MQVQKSFKGQSSYGTLYLVPTPIGNLQDMTFRSVQILKDVDLICAEDTRNTGLCSSILRLKRSSTLFMSTMLMRKKFRFTGALEVRSFFGSGF